MGLTLGSRAMIAAIRAARPETGLKKLTAEVNELLPPKMRVEKHELRDFVRSLDEPTNPPVAATKPRDDSFLVNTARAFSDLREAEREFLLNLDHDSINKMHNPGHSPNCHPVAHLRHHLKVFLVLQGVNPCVPFVSPKDTGNVVMNAMVLRCLSPLMERLNLESYGFKLLYIATDVLTADTRFQGFKGSWVLADTQSPAWPLVHQIFVTTPTNRMPQKLICLVLGFPVQTDNIINQVDIKDRTETTLLQDSFDQNTCRVDVMKIYCDDGDVEYWEKIKEYFLVCQQLTSPLGTALTLDMNEHPMMKEWCRARADGEIAVVAGV